MSAAAGAEPDAIASARERLSRLFGSFDRLTPDELARIGYRPASDEEREDLLAAVDEAAARSGRTVLVDEARTAAREAVLRRYSDGTLHPTWLVLNWGLSSGTVEDRVAIVEALADAAAAVAVEDVLDPEVAEALALDAAAVVGMAVGIVSEGSLAHALAEPGDADLGRSPGRHRTRVLLAGAALFLAGLSGLGGTGIVAGVLLGPWSDDLGAGLVLLVFAVVTGVTLLALLAVNRRPNEADG